MLFRSGQQAVDRQAQQAQMLGDYMRNVQFEMGRANSLDEVRAIAEKYNHYMELEKAAIEHQQYLKQHAPRGYL